MNYRRINIDTASPVKPRARIMIIYTGGTFGMTYDADGVLVPFDFSLILSQLPTLRNLFLDITVISFETPVDSSNIHPEHWKLISKIIFENYHGQDGFVILHGTDTMAYSASAISFMLAGLSKPVIFTGAQLPIREPRSDARENLITALEIASARNDQGQALVPEVCIYFDYELLRGNRSKKVESMHFDAFQSGNYPSLAKAGVKIDYNHACIRKAGVEALQLLDQLDLNISVLKLFPGITPTVVEAIVGTPGMKALIIETYGSGNAPSAGWFIDLIKSALDKNILVLNISQCPGGMVVQGKYETSKALADIGVISGVDMTLEAAVTKLMVLLGTFGSNKTKHLIGVSLAGELSG
jgi:L-asparaginase